MKDEFRNITLQFIIGFVINLLSVYLFSLGLINLTSIIIISIGFIIFVIITGFQSKINGFESKLSNQDSEIKKLNERLKIQDQLIDNRADIKELQRYLKNGKK